MNGGEIVAALTKSHREIERSDVEHEREERVCAIRGRVDAPGPEHCRQYRNDPGDGALPSFAGIEKPLEKCRITRQACVQIAADSRREAAPQAERGGEGEEGQELAPGGTGDQDVTEERTC